MADIKLLVLCVVMAVLCLELEQGQAQGDVRFSLRNITYWNNSFVALEDIGEGDDALLCVTDFHNCCRPPYSNAIGNWFFPNETRVPSSGNQWDFYRTRGHKGVLLHRRRGGAEGIYRCEIPDTMNVIRTIYIGVYNTAGGARLNFVLNGITYQNHSMVFLENIGEGDQALLCNTNFRSCCRHPAIGNWFFPNGSRVPSSGNQWDFHRTRGRKVVLLHRRRGGAEGIYRCEIPDAMNVKQAIYIGVYNIDTHEELRVMPLQFELTSELNATTPTFTLTCTSTGGPATTVSWTVNNRTVTEDENHHITSQILTDPEKATYHHTLAVTGRLLGQYECRVSNIKSSDRKELGVVNASPPTGLSAAPINFEEIDVCWNPPTSGATKYQIFYKALGSNNNSGSVNVFASVEKCTQLKLSGGFIYNITMVTKSQHLPSTVAGPITVTLAMVRNVMVKVVNATALLVSWDGLKTLYLSNYTIYYSAFCAKLNKVVDNFTKVIPPPKTYEIVNIRELRAGVEHKFQVTASLKVDEEVYDGEKPVSAEKEFDEAPFQIHIGPVTFCKTWNTDKAEKIESYIHTGIAKAISCHCNCEFPATFIRSGIFLCWNTQDEVTYRSVIVATEGQSATKLLGFLENWVKSKPVLRVEKFGLWVSPEHPVRITSLDLGNPQCTSTTCGESTTETPTTVNPTPEKD